MKPVALLGLVISLITVTFAAHAGPFSAARTVNSSIISNYDVSQREKLLTAFGVRDADLSALALAQLTDDRLKAEAANAFGLSLPEEGVQEALEEYAARRQMSVGALEAMTRRAGVAPETLAEFISVSVLWRDLVNLRFRERASPSEADIENVLNFAASGTQESVFLREIAIPFAERGTDGARALVERIIRDVRNGANFAGFARQYSRAPTASKGGAIGWTPANRLPPQIAGQVLTLQPGDVTAPIEVPAGVIVIQLADIREEQTDQSQDVTATYIRLDVAGDDSATEAQSVALEIETCSDAESRMSEFGPASGRYGPDPLGSIPTDIALVIARLDANEVGIVSPSDAGSSIIVLCNRAATADPEQIDLLQNQVFAQRMNSYADSFLNELRADALIQDK